MELPLNTKLRKIVTKAVEEARSLNEQKVRPEHIFLSLLADERNKAVHILTKHKINTSDLYDLIAQETRNNDLTPRFNTNTGTPTLSDDSKALLKRVETEYTNTQSLSVDTTHLMLAILSSNLPFNNKIEMEYELNYTNFKKAMTDMQGQLNAFYEEDEMDAGYSGNDTQQPKNEGKKTKTPALDKFCTDYTKMADNGSLEPVIGRGDEIRRVIQILTRKKKNNPVIIGEAGTGKTAIVEGMARLLRSNDCPSALLNKRLLSLDLTSLVAGTKYRGQLKERMQAILRRMQGGKKYNPVH